MGKVIYPIKEVEGKLKLKIPLRIRNPENGKELSVLALLDTGADTCTFPSMLSRTLGLKYDKDTRKEKGTKGISGEVLPTYVHGVEIYLLDNSRKKILRKLQVVCNSLERNDIPPIVGTANFLEKFIVNIDYINREITLNW